MNIKKSDTERWFGSYKGVGFEINHWINNGMEDIGASKHQWSHYIILHLNRIPAKYRPSSFWLKGELKSSWVHYRYYEHPIIGRIEFHGGISWYSKESGWDGEGKVIKIGCDYQHSWDRGSTYDLEYVKDEVIKTIDSFLTFIPDYKYWCCGNGKLYDLSDGVLKNGVFHSKEYFGDKEWYKELESQMKVENNEQNF